MPVACQAFVVETNLSSNAICSNQEGFFQKLTPISRYDLDISNSPAIQFIWGTVPYPSIQPSALKGVGRCKQPW